MKEPQRSILIMRDVQGLSYQEVEQTLNLSQSQVKVYLHRARRKLREDVELRRIAQDANILAVSSNDSADTGLQKCEHPTQ